MGIRSKPGSGPAGLVGADKCRTAIRRVPVRRVLVIPARIGRQLRAAARKLNGAGERSILEPEPARRVGRRRRASKNGAQGRNRTTDTRIFSPLLYRLSYLGMDDGAARLTELGYR